MDWLGVPAELWTALLAALSGIVVRTLSNKRVAKMREIITEKEDMIEGMEKCLNEVRRDNLKLGRHRFRLRQTLADNGVDDPTELESAEYEPVTFKRGVDDERS